MKEIKDLIEKYNKLTTPEEVTIDMTNFLKEQYEKQMKDISEFFNCYMISPYKASHIIAGKQYTCKAFLKGEEVTLILSDSEYKSNELEDTKSLEYFTMCIANAWTMSKLEKEKKLTKDVFGTIMCIVNNAFYMMNESHQKLNKDFDKAFKAKVIELDKKFDWNNRN